ncbi:MAG: pyridoxal phosphate-dependent aminotransferase [Firmicutes bacterium]|nr:pyridoxal phosphate-dependent aminotransferase [Bacillota bacterium]
MKFSGKIEKCDYSPIRKFHPYQQDAEHRGSYIYHFNIGQPDIKTPKVFFDAIRDFSGEVLGYAPSQGIPQLIDAVQIYYARIGCRLMPQDIAITQGGSEALQLALSVILDNGDDILIPEPFYPNYNTFITMAGANIVPVPTSPEEGYRYAVREKLEAALTPSTRAIMVTNPGNPTGLILSPEEWEILADFVIDHDLFLIADEVYREFSYESEELFSFASMHRLAEHVIIIDSVSKRFSATGARVGELICRNQQFMERLMKLLQARLSVATLEQLASVRLYEMGTGYFGAAREEYKKRRDVLCEELSKIPGVSFSKPSGAFYMMVTLPVDDAEKFLVWLLASFNKKGRETLMFAPAAGFYKTPGMGRQECRLAYVINEEEIRRGIQLLARAIDEYNRQ